MPELPHFNPTVSVFHFTSKVSSAKIRKYKLATERGMTNGHSGNANRAIKRQASQSSSVPVSGEESKNQSRLKLNVRLPNDMTDGETIAVKQPSCSKASTKRDWNDAFGKDRPAQGHNLLAGESSSELSSVDSNVSTPKSPQTTHQQTEGSKVPATRASQRESYGDLMSYYIQDDDDDPSDSISVMPEVKATKLSKRSSKSQRTTAKPHAKMPTTSSFSQYPAAAQPGKTMQRPNHRETAAPPPQPQARPPIHFLSFEPIKIGPPDSLPLMIEKVEALSTALTEFGGVLPAPPSPKASAQSLPKRDQIDRERPDYRETFLAVGQGDHALTYGIQFIMNALQSWAQQRLTREHIIAMQQGQQNPASGILEQGLSAITLAGSPEGRAIAAFRTVVESGCLRVNTMVPTALSRALRKLYLQIDHLINQGTKQNSPWRCLSYHAQIQANKARIDSWKDEQARAHQEMIRQHQLSHQQTMRQMGLPTHLTSTMFYQQPQDPLAAYVDQPGDNYNLIRLPMQVMDRPAIARSALPATNAMPLPLPPGSRPTVHGAVASTGSMPPEKLRSHPEQDSTMSTAYLLPRSGQSMHLSFAPSAGPAMQNSQHAQTPTQLPAQAPHKIADGANPRASGMTPKTLGNTRQAGQKQNQHVHSHGRPQSGFTAINAR